MQRALIIGIAGQGFSLIAKRPLSNGYELHRLIMS